MIKKSTAGVLDDLAFWSEPVVAGNYGEHTWLDVQILLLPR